MAQAVGSCHPHGRSSQPSPLRAAGKRTSTQALVRLPACYPQTKRRQRLLSKGPGCWRNCPSSPATSDGPTFPALHSDAVDTQQVTLREQRRNTNLIAPEETEFLLCLFQLPPIFFPLRITVIWSQLRDTVGVGCFSLCKYSNYNLTTRLNHDTCVPSWITSLNHCVNKYIGFWRKSVCYMLISFMNISEITLFYAKYINAHSAVSSNY